MGCYLAHVVVVEVWVELADVGAPAEGEESYDGCDGEDECEDGVVEECGAWDLADCFAYGAEAYREVFS